MVFSYLSGVRRRRTKAGNGKCSSVTRIQHSRAEIGQAKRRIRPRGGPAGLACGAAAGAPLGGRCRGAVAVAVVAWHPLVDGVQLTRYANNPAHPLSIGWAAAVAPVALVAAQVATVLPHTHQATAIQRDLAIHRDVKPSDILLLVTAQQRCWTSASLRSFVQMSRSRPPRGLPLSVFHPHSELVR